MTTQSAPEGDQSVPSFDRAAEPNSAPGLSVVTDEDPDATWAAQTLSALDGLPEIERVALYMSYWRQMTLVQVAAELAISEAAVHAHVMHGMKTLAGVLMGEPASVAQDATDSLGCRE